MDEKRYHEFNDIHDVKWTRFLMKIILKKLGYADFNKPAGINIYPKNFESKEKVIQIFR